MALSLTQENKASITITNDTKDSGITWDEATFTWDSAEGTWDVPGLVVARETKTNITITNETKNA